jgi:RNA polymerase sigma-70 factor (ECF subfamily)
MTSADIEQLYREHQPLLVRWLARLVRCHETAADLAQESYVRVAGAAGEQAIMHPRAFLFRTARNLAFDHLRKMRARNGTTEPLEKAIDLPCPHPSAERALLDRQRVILFKQALQTLSPRCREIFLLHRLHHCTYGQIAHRLGISESAVEKHIMRALSRCRNAMATYDSEST